MGPGGIPSPLPPPVVVSPSNTSLPPPPRLPPPLSFQWSLGVGPRMMSNWCSEHTSVELQKGP